MELNKTVEAEALRLQGEKGQKSVIEWRSGSSGDIWRNFWLSQLGEGGGDSTGK